MSAGTISAGTMDYSLDIKEGQNYVVEFTVNGENFSVTKPCLNGNSSNNIGVDGALTIGDSSGTNGNMFVHNGYTYLMMIASNAGFEGMGSIVYRERSSFVAIMAIDEGAPQITCTLTSIKLAS